MKTWEITNMICVPNKVTFVNVVKFISYIRKASETVDDKVYTASISGSIELPVPEEGNFTDYNNLTFEQVCTWLETLVDVSTIDQQLNDTIDFQKNPPIIQLPLPWENNIDIVL